jgi:hypothetical protein
MASLGPSRHTLGTLFTKCLVYICLVTLLFLCLCSLSETILEFTGHVLHVSHSTSADSAFALGLKIRVVTDLGPRISTARTTLLLDMEGNLATSATGGVGLVMSLSEGSSTLSL